MYVHLLHNSLHALTVDRCNVARVTIDMLPDIALIEIFDFYLDEDDIDEDEDDTGIDGGHIEAWHKLVHVCREWRNLVFGSPRRLNLRILCGPRTTVIKKLDTWPPLPIVVWTDGRRGTENIITALGYNRTTTAYVNFNFPIFGIWDGIKFWQQYSSHSRR
jgi:hypothetical protein